MIKTILEKLVKKKKNNDVNADMTQLKYSNNKCYTYTFRNI